MIKAPCKDCPDRKQGCHSACEKYIAFRKERDELNALKFEDAKKHMACYRNTYNRRSAKAREGHKKHW